MSRIRLGVLISGRGSNLLAILEAIERGDLPADVALVVSNRADAPGLAHARERRVPTLVADRASYPDRAERQRSIGAALAAACVDLVVCAGWSEIFVPSFVAAYPGRILNTHPSLLPSFKGGLRAQADALAYGVKVSGCTIHFVTDDVDGGPIVLQRAVPVLEDDTAETLAARILAEEHRALPEAIRLYADGRLSVVGCRVRILPPR
ncbi:MAG: phosphoribosylglycinamide formyltransferase [Solirubrobacterales bacterium]|nr:phosphoribosylglycinamide formyltransferase [Solirubrobacterales bacterium]